MLNFAAIDFETANQYRSSVCSVGIVIVKEGEIVDKIYSLIRPRPNFYTAWTTAIHGLRYEDTENEPEFPDIWHYIIPRLEDLPLVAHNSSFDSSCLRAVHEQYGMKYPNYKFYCTCIAAKKQFPQMQNHKLPTVAKLVGFDFQNHHHALADAEACAEIAKIIIP